MNNFIEIESLYIILYLGVVYWNLFFILEDKFFYWFIDNVCKLVVSDYKKDWIGRRLGEYIILLYYNKYLKIWFILYVFIVVKVFVRLNWW